jgi:hypothetical protein
MVPSGRSVVASGALARVPLRQPRHQLQQSRQWSRKLRFLLILFLQVMGPGLVALGLYDQFQRRQAPRNS